MSVPAIVTNVELDWWWENRDSRVPCRRPLRRHAIPPGGYVDI